MRPLLDQNLSTRLLSSLESRFPGSAHVRELGLERADDQRIWEYAGAESFVIVSKDTDFYQRSILFGHPPKVIWLALGNCTTAAVRDMLESAADTIEEFDSDGERSFLVLGPR
ncbi:MAG: DUF5615 family PIN-like protein [Planctomycetota bacterium]